MVNSFVCCLKFFTIPELWIQSFTSQKHNLPFKFRCIIYLYWSWGIHLSKDPISFFFFFSIWVPYCPSTIFEKNHLCLLAVLSRRICHPAARSTVSCQPPGEAPLRGQKPSSSHAVSSQCLSMGGVLRPGPLRVFFNELFTFTVWGSPFPNLLSYPFRCYPPINLS